MIPGKFEIMADWATVKMSRCSCQQNKQSAPWKQPGGGWNTRILKTYLEACLNIRLAAFPIFVDLQKSVAGSCL